MMGRRQQSGQWILNACWNGAFGGPGAALWSSAPSDRVISDRGCNLLHLFYNNAQKLFFFFFPCWNWGWYSSSKWKCRVCLPKDVTRSGQNINALKRCFWCWKYQALFSLMVADVYSTICFRQILRVCPPLNVKRTSEHPALTYWILSNYFTCLEYLIWFVL